MFVYVMMLLSACLCLFSINIVIVWSTGYCMYVHVQLHRPFRLEVLVPVEVQGIQAPEPRGSVCIKMMQKGLIGHT
jgi:hypothetical protein